MFRNFIYITIFSPKIHNKKIVPQNIFYIFILKLSLLGGNFFSRQPFFTVCEANRFVMSEQSVLFGWLVNEGGIISCR